MEKKNLQLEIKSISDDGTFEGYANVYDVIDRVGDFVEKGAFTKTIQERPNVPVYYEHEDLIGRGTLEDTPEGPFIKGRLSLGVAKAREVYELLKDGVLSGLSIGWLPVSGKAVKSGDVRRIKEGRIFEVTLTAVPVNEWATVTAYKSLIEPDAGAEKEPEPPPATTRSDGADENAALAIKAIAVSIQTLLR